MSTPLCSNCESLPREYARGRAPYCADCARELGIECTACADTGYATDHALQICNTRICACCDLGHSIDERQREMAEAV